MLKESFKDIDVKTLDIDTFGEIVDEALKRNRVQLLATMPEGSLDVEIQDNTGGGPVMQFYIAWRILKAAMDATFEILPLDPDKKGEILDEMLKIVKDNVMETRNKE